jgi:hypothetical protein
MKIELRADRKCVVFWKNFFADTTPGPPPSLPKRGVGVGRRGRGGGGGKVQQEQQCNRIFYVGAYGLIRGIFGVGHGDETVLSVPTNHLCER